MTLRDAPLLIINMNIALAKTLDVVLALLARIGIDLGDSVDPSANVSMQL